MEQKKKSYPADKRPVGSTALTISRQQGTGLSKQQLAFNKLVAKIDQLKQELEQTDRLLNEKLAYYGKHIHPLLQQEVDLRKQYVKGLYRYFQQKKPSLFSKRQKEILKDVMAAQLNAILSFGQEEPDEALREIFEAVEGLSYEDANAQELSDLKSDMEEALRHSGIDLDLDELNADMSPEEMVRLLTEKEEAFRKQAAGSHHHTTSGKTARQLAKEEKEKLLQAMKQKNVSTLYKQLVKVFHPDLEQDPGKKEEKEELMKQLTSAYEQQDMYTLLSLEIAWIQKDQNHLHTLAEDKLKLYNDVLREQARNLEDEIFNLTEHPRFRPLQELVDFSTTMKKLDLSKEKTAREMIVLHLQDFVHDFSRDEAAAIGIVKNIIAMEEETRNLDKIWGRRNWK